MNAWLLFIGVIDWSLGVINLAFFDETFNLIVGIFAISIGTYLSLEALK